MSTPSLKSIAVIGAGLSGMCAAFHLQKKYKVTLFEKNKTPGGYPRPLTLNQGPDSGRIMDTGSILVNDRSVPELKDFLEQIEVPLCPATHDFGFHCLETGLSYSSHALFAQRSNLFNPRHWLFASGIRRFLDRFNAMFRAGRLENTSLGEWLAHEPCRKDVVRDFIRPMAATVWQGTDVDILDVPILTLASLFENLHLIFNKDAGPWYRVGGGSTACSEAFSRAFRGNVITQARVTSVTRGSGGARVVCQGLIDTRFDAVVLATHADQALALLRDPSREEKHFLGAFRYMETPAIIHTDRTRLPNRTGARAHWNLTRHSLRDTCPRVSVTRDLNRILELDTTNHYLVTVNPVEPVPDEHIICQVMHSRPLFSREAMSIRNRLQRLNGRNKTYFCGNYLGYGALGDGIRSALTVARQLGIDEP